MSRDAGRAILAVAGFLFLSVGFAQRLEIYRAQHRPAAELEAVATSAMGGDGTVTLDARTATLILNGSPAAIERTLKLLKQMDRRPRHVVLTQTSRDFVELDRLGVEIHWQASFGSTSVGTFSRPADGVDVELNAHRATTENFARSRLRLLEGSFGTISTGRALPVLFDPYWGTTSYVSVETGFEARAQILGAGASTLSVQLELRPFAGRVEGGELQYIAASTSLIVKPGETVVVGEATTGSTQRQTSPTGRSEELERRQAVLLISVEIEP